MSIVLALVLSSAHAATLTVDATGGGDFASLQDAVDAALSGDRLVINSGTYSENITISDKNLSLEGAGSISTTIWGDGSAAALSISGSTVTVTGMAIMNGMGGIELRGGSATLGSLLISENAGAETGGGLALLEGATATLNASEIEKNGAERGGGIYVNSSSTLNVTESLVSNNTASASGGGAYSSGNLSIQTSTVQDNSAGTDGGGVYGSGNIPDLYLSDFYGNSATNGGAIAITDASAGTVSYRIRGCDLAYNSASGAGGAIYLSGIWEIYVKELVLWMNHAGSEGGALYMSGIEYPWVSNVRAWYNTAADGGGIFAADLHGGQTNRISMGGNIATGSGGGAYYSSPTRQHAIVASRFLENTASTGAGLVIEGDNAIRHTVQNVDVSGNDGGGVAVVASVQARIINTIAAGNTGVGIEVDSESLDSIIKYNDSVDNDTNWGGALSDLTGVDGNISADPLYTRFAADGDPISDFLTLSEGSPAINTGKSDVFDSDGTRSDMGSYGSTLAEYGDSDGDGSGPTGGDCDDGDPLVHPGAEEVWYDGRDNDCAGDDDFDQDGDGYRHPTDCDDEDDTIHPGADDIDDDGIDSDCDGTDGEGEEPDPGADTGAPWEESADTGSEDPYEDADRDGYDQSEDCNDASAESHPDADEICDDGLDNDCDGLTDNADGDCIPASDKGCGCAVSDGGSSLWLLLVGLGALVRRRQSP
jgi:MYXO-CTERM domain-containing protein